VGLALPHQLWTGQEFLQSSAATVYWWMLWSAAAGTIVIWRILLPLWRSARYRLRVVGVVREASDVVSVYLTGRRLDRLPLRPGQFLNVRFLSRPGWTRANPFSLSIAPNSHTLRITAKTLGDGSARLAYLRPGTWALFEGPYGRLSSRARTQRKVLLAGAGVGITPLRALVEGLDYAPGEAIILQRYTAEPLFNRELETLATHRGLHVVDLPGPHTSTSVLGLAVSMSEDRCNVGARYRRARVFLCGPSNWTDGMERLLAADLPSDRIHTENFGW
jgi:ferredoxin-NADP reductase